MSILVFNAGSSSLKFALFDASASQQRASGSVAWSGKSQNATLTWRNEQGTSASRNVNVLEHAEAVRIVLDVLKELGTDLEEAVHAVGHRIVHGGTSVRCTSLIDNSIKAEIGRLSELAPLHNPPALRVIEATEKAFQGTLQVAVFDTAFFSNMPPRAYVYPLPYEWYTDYGVRRFGFHGISHAYCTDRAAKFLGRDVSELSLVICHLGQGCSATAVRDGAPVATTMGFTPLDGLMMGTRPGSIDPGILSYLERNGTLEPAAIERSIHHGSGLLGVSGISSDYRIVESAANSGSERARLALDMYADKVRAAIGALVVTLGQIDALVFTAGIGENSANLRSQVCHGLDCMGIRLDEVLNKKSHPDSDISIRDTAVRILILQCREELMIAREAKELIEVAKLV